MEHHCSKTTIDSLLVKDKFFNQDKDKKVFNVLKSITSTYFWGTGVTKIFQSYPIIDKNCKNLYTSSNTVSLNSIKGDAAGYWAKMVMIRTSYIISCHLIK